MSTLFQNQDINSFFQTALNRDFARQNLFRVLSITSGASNIIFDETDLVYITTTSLPQRAITNVSVPFMGLKFNVPGTATYPGSEAWQVTVRVPQDLGIRQKLELWTRATFDDATSTGSYNVADLGTIVIALMDKGGNVIRPYTLVGAYCVNVGTYTLNSTTAGEIVELPATLAYQFWIQPEATQLIVA